MLSTVLSSALPSFTKVAFWPTATKPSTFVGALNARLPAGCLPRTLRTNHPTTLYCTGLLGQAGGCAAGGRRGGARVRRRRSSGHSGSAQEEAAAESGCGVRAPLAHHLQITCASHITCKLLVQATSLAHHLRACSPCPPSACLLVHMCCTEKAYGEGSGSGVPRASAAGSPAEGKREQTGGPGGGSGEKC